MNAVRVEKSLGSNQIIQIVQGDITIEKVDAIINAANERLQHGGGVAWAISKQGGSAIQRESDDWIRQRGPGVADELKCSSIAMPAISTGIFGFPKERAADIIFSAIEEYFENNPSNIKIVKLVLFDQATVDVFVESWHDQWG